jgi:hypothetical protein
VIDHALCRHDSHPVDSLDAVLEADRSARAVARRLIETIC